MRVSRLFPALLVVITLSALLTGCGGNSASNSQTQNPPPPSASTVQVSLGDSPADWIMAFGMNVNSVTLGNSGGGTVNLVSFSTPMEMMQLMGTVQPLGIMNVPQGTYTTGTINLSSVEMGYMDPNTGQYVQKTLAGPFSGTVNFNPPLVIGSTPSVLSFDMNMGASVSIINGNVTLTPTFTATMHPISNSGQNPWQGWMHHMVGLVSSTSGSQFTTSMMMGWQSLTFTTNSSTQFVGFSGMGMMANGMMVVVDAVTEPDGSLLAQRVESMWSGSGGMMGGGIITGISGNPPTQLNVVFNNGIGGGMMMSWIAGILAVNVSSSTPYTFDSDRVDLTNLPFTPTFDASTIAKGQIIEAVSGSGMMGGGMMGGGTINASEIRLVEQGLRGTVSNYTANGSQATCMLNLAPDSAFATITGTSIVTVYQQGGTQLRGLSSIINGNQIEVRGLLFADAGGYKLVATWIAPQ